MNRLSINRRTQAVAAMVEGSSINSICRMTGIGFVQARLKLHHYPRGVML